MAVDPSDTEIQNPEPPETAPSAPAPGSDSGETPKTTSGEPSRGPSGGRVLESMLDRLYTSLLSGPALNCKPHRSRQRIDWAQLADLRDISVDDAMRGLLENGGEAKLTAQVPMPDHAAGARKWGKPAAAEDEEPLSVEQREQAQHWRSQQGLLNKLRSLTQDANTYEQDTGVHALSIGYPLLSIPPAVTGGRRILAPVAMIPVDLLIKSGGKPGITIRCAGNGNDRVIPNPALVAWIERETGQRLPDDLFGDDAGEDPWREINELVQVVCERLELEVPEPPVDETQTDEETAPANPPAPSDQPATTDPAAETLATRPTIQPTPLADQLGDRAAIVESAVLGLFPSSKQGLLRDTRDMLDNPPAPGSTPASAFIHPGVALDESEESDAPTNRYAAERFVTLADPFQAQTVKLSQTHTGLVVHGPPGTGKSQTITNIIGDHLARGQRVLFVCEKRTALDVVYNRLKHLGLADFCATVHDPQRDQRDLYMGIRAQLEDLADRKTHPRAQARVETIDSELTAIHDQLTHLHQKLMRPAPGRAPGRSASSAGEDTSGGASSSGGGGASGGSFHERVGRWLSLEVDELPDTVLVDVLHATLDEASPTLTRLFDRGIQLGWAQNPWQQAASRKPDALDAYLARRPDAVRQSLASLAGLGQEADRTLDLSIPDFDPDEALSAQAERRESLSEKIKAAFAHPEAQAYATRVAGLPSAERDSLIGRVCAEKPRLDRVRQAPLDTELKLTIQNDLPGLRTLNTELAALDAYLKAISSWTGLFAFGIKKQAKQLLAQYGLLTPGKESADRLVTFLNGIKDRILLEALRADLCGTQEPAPAHSRDDEPLLQTIGCFDQLLGSYALAEEDATLKPRYLQALNQDNVREGLDRSGPRAQALQALESAMADEPLLDVAWQTRINTAHRKAAAAAPTLQALVQGFNDADPALRLLADWHSLPGTLKGACDDLLNQGIDSETAFATLSKRVLGHEIRATLAADPELLRTDAHDLSALFDRFEKLQDEKRGKVRDAIEHQWIEKQKERLLVGTGSRLNSLGASTRQRLYVRGSRAMRLRQVLHLGQVTRHEDGGGDPLFDLCPVWLCSPETVAQVFPREPVFDVLIFDEASQLRLEEALPVLTRAKRIVIAGDPKQLPPTRFFEAAVADSGTVEIETEDDLFEAQQAEAEDLLSAALNLSVEESHLNVHYRSHNADLIGFSNEYFYSGRLQAIPGHPANVAKTPPLKVRRANGIYEKGLNPIEAEAVVDLVVDLLNQKKPPSIGIATFNLSQRDLIFESLNERAEEDPAFGHKLSTARQRVGDGSFEGLFVKNLENVQGDERDVIIISTTYGKNDQGKFYRRFGPLAMPGGGRRLNVLVTRARKEVHLVTSIPSEAYNQLEALPEGTTPSGSWLLFAYLRYAQRIADLYESDEAAPSHDQEATDRLTSSPTLQPSDFVNALGQQTTQTHHHHASLYWGNDGFCVDIALQSSGELATTHGVLTDFTRFDGAPDPVEWDIYRTGILKWQGWAFHRVWTPHFVRDPKQTLEGLGTAPVHP